ncbi:hypothetical protein K445DRAFT_166235 [Daldinia sp. EC12]|nr:hypothetical protein K445DRAFT_166235 [Daldinia sp. EC12]
MRFRGRDVEEVAAINSIHLGERVNMLKSNFFRFRACVFETLTFVSWKNGFMQCKLSSLYVLIITIRVGKF